MFRKNGEKKKKKKKEVIIDGALFHNCLLEAKYDKDSIIFDRERVCRKVLQV